MSYLAIGAVTQAITTLLTNKLNRPALMGGSTQFRVTALPPDDDRVSADSGVNLFLYRVSEHPFLKNTPWAGDRAHPGGSGRPPLAVTLNYLVTAYAKKVANSAQDDISAHQLLGDAMAILHDCPVLNNVHDAEFDADVDMHFARELRESCEKVKITLLPIALEEFSKIWTGLTKAYRLSVAYEVSLVQIAPLAPTPLPRPAPQSTSVRVIATGAPSIGAVTPNSGPVGTEITLTGASLTVPGRQTTVTVGGVEMDQSELVRASSNEIVLAIPVSLPRGPVEEITVTCDGLESNPATFEVRPWVSGLRPLRGTTGIPVAIPFKPAAGATVSVSIDGQAAAVTVDAAAKVVRAVVPRSVATNGPKAVVLTIDGGTPQRSNALLYEVMPAIGSITAGTAGTPAGTQLVIQGERLRGKEVFVRYGKVLGRVGDTSDPATHPNADTGVSFQFDRVLPAGGAVSVLVDGRESNSLPRRLLRIEPAQGAAGDSILLVGSALSGRSVTVSFGAVPVSVGPQPFANQFEIAVPAGLAAGVVQVHATVDGLDTGSLPFTVLI